MQITYERVHELFQYHNGQLMWTETRGSRAIKGDIAGYVAPDGYSRIKTDKNLYLTHRLIWLYKKGYFPENDIDHINRNPNDNRIENLREVSRQCNLRNCGNSKNNSSGVTGVYLSKRDYFWVAHICINYKDYHLGRSKDFCEAVLLRLAAEQCLGWGDCNHNTPARNYAIENCLFKPPIDPK